MDEVITVLHLALVALDEVVEVDDVLKPEVLDVLDNETLDDAELYLAVLDDEVDERTEVDVMRVGRLEEDDERDYILQYLEHTIIIDDDDAVEVNVEQPITMHNEILDDDLDDDVMFATEILVHDVVDEVDDDMLCVENEVSEQTELLSLDTLHLADTKYFDDVNILAEHTQYICLKAVDA